MSTYTSSAFLARSGQGWHTSSVFSSSTQVKPLGCTPSFTACTAAATSPWIHTNFFHEWLSAMVRNSRRARALHRTVYVRSRVGTPGACSDLAQSLNRLNCAPFFAASVPLPQLLLLPHRSCEHFSSSVAEHKGKKVSAPSFSTDHSLRHTPDVFA